MQFFLPQGLGPKLELRAAGCRGVSCCVQTISAVPSTPTAQLTIHREVVVALAEVPPGSTFQGYADFVVQELVLRAEVTRYRRQCWRSPDGRTLVAPLPADLEGRHFGPKLRA